MFGHERFEAYQLSIRMLKISIKLVENIPPGYSAVKDQFKRASLSIPLNIAEGSGKSSKSDKRRYYEIARGSAMECAAICDVLEIMDDRFKEEIRESKELLKSIICILTVVCNK